MEQVTTFTIRAKDRDTFVYICEAYNIYFEFELKDDATSPFKPDGSIDVLMDRDDFVSYCHIESDLCDEEREAIASSVEFGSFGF